MLAELSNREKAMKTVVTLFFALFVIMLPRYTDTAKAWYLALLLVSLGWLMFNLRQFLSLSSLERLFLVAVGLNFAWIAFTFYANGEPGRGASFLWGRHFYFIFMIPMFLMLRKVEISNRHLLFIILISVSVSLADILIDLAQGIDHRLQGMNPNGFGPVQLCLSGIALFLLLRYSDNNLRWLAVASLMMGLATVVFSKSKITWLTLVVLSVFLIFYLSRAQPLRRRFALALGIVALLISSYLLPIVENRVDQGIANMQAYFASDDYRDASRLGSFGTRMELWKTAWNIFQENPWLGVGVGGFKTMARAHSERYRVNQVVHRYKYAHNQYLAALATRGIPGLILFLLVMITPVYIAMSNKSDDADIRFANRSLMFIGLTYLIGCLAEDHFEAKSATMFVSIWVPLLLAKISIGKSNLPITSEG